jgi:hypothetical protein
VSQDNKLQLYNKDRLHEGKLLKHGLPRFNYSNNTSSPWSSMLQHRRNTTSYLSLMPKLCSQDTNQEDGQPGRRSPLGPCVFQSSSQAQRWQSWEFSACARGCINEGVGDRDGRERFSLGVDRRDDRFFFLGTVSKLSICSTVTCLGLNYSILCWNIFLVRNYE